MPHGIGYAHGSKASDYARKPMKKFPSGKSKAKMSVDRVPTPKSRPLQALASSKRSKVRMAHGPRSKRSFSDSENMRHHEGIVETYAPKKKGNPFARLFQGH